MRRATDRNHGHSLTSPCQRIQGKVRETATCVGGEPGGRRDVRRRPPAPGPSRVRPGDDGHRPHGPTRSGDATWARGNGTLGRDPAGAAIAAIPAPVARRSSVSRPRAEVASVSSVGLGVPVSVSRLAAIRQVPPFPPRVPTFVRVAFTGERHVFVAIAQEGPRKKVIPHQILQTGRRTNRLAQVRRNCVHFPDEIARPAADVRLQPRGTFRPRAMGRNGTFSLSQPD